MKGDKSDPHEATGFDRPPDRNGFIIYFKDRDGVKCQAYLSDEMLDKSIFDHRQSKQRWLEEAELDGRGG